MARLGNTGASSLLRAAQAGYERTQTYNDSMAAYEFELSAKTQDDFNTYKSHLEGRIKSLSDPSKQLSLQKTLTSAYRSFNSAEIGRQSIAVNYGDISKTDKLGKMMGLYQQAVGNGDYSLAQSIESQMGSLQISIQGDAQAAASKASASASASVTGTLRKFQVLQDKIDQAFQTGQQTQDDKGNLQYVDARGRAIALGQLLQQKHDFLSSVVKSEGDGGSHAEALATLEKSPDYQGIVGSGLYNKLTGQDPTIGVGTTWKQDNYGNWTRNFAPLVSNDKGIPTKGLVSDPNGEKFNVRTQKINTDPNSPSTYFKLKEGQLNGDPTKLITYDARTGKYIYTDAATGQNAVSKSGNDKTAAENAQLLGKADTMPGEHLAPTAGGFGDPGNYSTFFNEAGSKAGHDLTHPKSLVHDLGGLIGGAWHGLVNASNHRDATLTRLSNGAQQVQAQAAARALDQARQAAQISSANAAAAAATRAQQVYAQSVLKKPTPTPTYNFASGTVNNVPGAPAIPAPVIAASNQPGTKSFTQKYLPAAY